MEIPKPTKYHEKAYQRCRQCSVGLELNDTAYIWEMHIQGSESERQGWLVRYCLNCWNVLNINPVFLKDVFAVLIYQGGLIIAAGIYSSAYHTKIRFVNLRYAIHFEYTLNYVRQIAGGFSGE